MNYSTINQKFNRIVRDMNFTQSLDFTTISSNEDDPSKMNSILDQFCFHIIPQIQHNIQCLTVDLWSMDRILSIGNYFKLHKLILVNLTVKMAIRIFYSMLFVFNINK